MLNSSDCIGRYTPGAPLLSVTLTGPSQKYLNENMTIIFPVTYYGITKEEHEENTQDQEEIQPITFRTDALLSTSRNWLYRFNANSL